MKKLATTICAMALVRIVFAQGTVIFANGTGTLLQTNGLAAGLTSGNTAPTPGGFYYEVLTAPSTVTSVDTSLQALLSGVWSDTGLLATNTPFSAGGRAAAGGTRVVNNWAPGLMQSFIVVGWSADHGTTWAQVAAQLTGVQLFNIGGNYAWNEGPFYGGW